MRSKNAKPMTADESAHVEAVKSIACVVCNASPPVEAHHIEQGDHFTVIGVCQFCHRGPKGWHGDKTMWRIHKLTELGALNETLRRVAAMETA